jgi:NAD(P)-dependent dehydrogenase (short-subunit alcohol dehydrogenase family)
VDFPGRVFPEQVDLTDVEAICKLARRVESEAAAGLSGLVHCAGALHKATVASGDVEFLEMMYATNLRAPYVLSQSLLPVLEASRGTIIFINSTAGLTARGGAVGYSSTKHAMRALADGLRDEVNERGIRVVSIYPGRTATRGVDRAFRAEGRDYDPSLLLQPEWIADLVRYALELPSGAELTDITIRPSRKSY